MEKVSRLGWGINLQLDQFWGLSHSPSEKKASSDLLCVCVVLQHYKQPELYATILHYMNTTFTGLFSIECMMKIHAYGFRVSTQMHRKENYKCKLSPVGQGWLFFEAWICNFFS